MGSNDEVDRPMLMMAGFQMVPEAMCQWARCEGGADVRWRDHTNKSSKTVTAPSWADGLPPNAWGSLLANLAIDCQAAVRLTCKDWNTTFCNYVHRLTCSVPAAWTEQHPRYNPELVSKGSLPTITCITQHFPLLQELTLQDVVLEAVCTIHIGDIHQQGALDVSLNSTWTGDGASSTSRPSEIIRGGAALAELSALSQLTQLELAQRANHEVEVMTWLDDSSMDGVATLTMLRSLKLRWPTPDTSLAPLLLKISTWTRLTELVLERCGLTHQNMACMSKIPHLASLSLISCWPHSATDRGGESPDSMLSHIMKLTDLERLVIQYCELGYPSCFTSLKRLSYLELSIPDCFSHVASIRKLSHLTALQHLILDCGLNWYADETAPGTRSCEAARCISCLTLLKSLQFTANRCLAGASFTRAIASLPQLTSLHVLWQGDCPATPLHTMSALSNPLPSLKELYVNSTDATAKLDPNLSFVRSLPHLTSLSLLQQSLQTDKLVHLSVLTQLQVLNLQFSTYSESIIQGAFGMHIAALKTLQSLDLSFSKPIKCGLEWKPFTALTQLSSLKVELDCEGSGEPEYADSLSCFGLYSNLRVLGLEVMGGLEGAAWEVLGKLQRLHSLYVWETARDDVSARCMAPSFLLPLTRLIQLQELTLDLNVEDVDPTMRQTLMQLPELRTCCIQNLSDRAAMLEDE